MARPTVSVVIPTYNAGRYVETALESIYQQTYQDLEIIVVDDGSTDDTEARLFSHRDRISYIRQENAGVSVARNRGVLAARGELIALLDADDQWLPTKLDRQTAAFNRNPETVLVYTDFNRTINIHGPRRSRLASLKHRGTGFVFYNLLRENFIATSSVVMRRDALAKTGLFDPHLRGPEDIDLWLRLACIGDFACIDEILVDYRLHGQNSVGTLRFARERAKAQELFLARWGSDSRARKLMIECAGTLWWDLAYSEWSARNIDQARRAYWKSAALGKMRIRATIRAAACMLPSSFLRQLRT